MKKIIKLTIIPLIQILLSPNHVFAKELSVDLSAMYPGASIRIVDGDEWYCIWGRSEGEISELKQRYTQSEDKLRSVLDNYFSNCSACLDFASEQGFFARRM